MQKKLPELSIFFPFWNESKNITRVVETAAAIAPSCAEKWEIIMVDDGSKDDTLKKAQNLVKKYKNFKTVSHFPNRGYGAALKEGFSNSQYDYVVFTDGDGQFDFSEIKEFLEKINDADIVIGRRAKRRDNFIRHILMNLLKVWDLVLFGFYYRDVDCGFKMFRKKALDKIMPFRSEGAMITTEILAKAKIKSLKVKEVDVTHYPRKFGNQTGANIPVVVRAILESFILWLDIHNGRV